MTFKSSYIPWILTAILAIAFFLYLKGCIGAKQAIAAGDNSKDSITYWKGIASLRKTPEDFAQATKGYLDSVSKAFDSKPAKIQEVIKYITTAHDTLYTDAEPIIVHDTLKAVTSLSEEFNSNYYNIFAHIETGGKGSFLQFVGYDTVTTIFKNVSTGNIFNRKNFLELDIKNANPFIVVTGAHAYRQELPAPKKWAIIGGIGYSYPFGVATTRPIFSIGIFAGKTLIRF